MGKYFIFLHDTLTDNIIVLWVSRCNTVIGKLPILASLECKIVATVRVEDGI